MTTNKNGFTIVELIIVVVIIGILAAIAIVAFNGIQGRADDAAIKSDLNQAIKIAMIFEANNGRYPYPTVAEIAPLDFNATKGSYNTDIGNFVYCLSDHGGSLRAVFGGATRRGKMWYVDSNYGGVPREYTGPAHLGVSMSEVCANMMGVPSSSIALLRGYAPEEGGWQSWIE